MSATNDELLRLARKAFPGERFEVWPDGQVHRTSRPFSSPAACFPPRNRGDGQEIARRAEHAALLVLAGEIDIATVTQAIEQGRASERERIRTAIGVLVDEMRRDAEEQGVPFDGDEGMYRSEVDALRALEVRFLNIPEALDALSPDGET